MAQSIEMEGQRIGRDADRARNFARRHATWSGLHQEPVDLKPMFLCERRHVAKASELSISTNIEKGHWASEEAPSASMH